MAPDLSATLVAVAWCCISLLVEIECKSLSHNIDQYCDPAIRERYCKNDSLSCLRCQVGPTCPVRGARGEPEGTLLIRGPPENRIRDGLISMLNDERAKKADSGCVPILHWDETLAEMAQAWADQCALVQYSGEERKPKLFHDEGRELRNLFHGEAGISQSVHWARTNNSGLTDSVIKALLDSDIRTEEGAALVGGGIGFEGGGDVIRWAHATHVGCGWIQFSIDGRSNENFMVCDYGVGRANKTTCDDDNVQGDLAREAEEIPFITYYQAPEQVIKDVKKCLTAVRCRRRQLRLASSGDDNDINDECPSSIVDRCLSAPSGLRFIPMRQLRNFARSSSSAVDLSELADVEASRCKIDTILCSLNSDAFACDARVGRCLPLLESNATSTATATAPPRRRPLLFECECVDGLVLADGTRGGDCQGNDEDNESDSYCLVRRSPCIALGLDGQVELSTPDARLGSLIHRSRLACHNRRRQLALLDPK